jgi:hypothetical protein
MVGLDEDEFWDRLQEPGVKLYLHELSPGLLPLFERYLHGREGIQALIDQCKLVPLPALTPIEIDEPFTATEIRVTLLPAGHCPGSVMYVYIK